MLGRVSVLFVLFLLIVPSDAAHPQHHRPGGITSRVGAGDVFGKFETLILYYLS